MYTNTGRIRFLIFLPTVSTAVLQSSSGQNVTSNTYSTSLNSLVCGRGLSAFAGPTMVDVTMSSSSGAHGFRVGGS